MNANAIGAPGTGAAANGGPTSPAAPVDPGAAPRPDPTPASTNAPNLAHALDFLERLVGLRAAILAGRDAAAALEPPRLAYYDDASAFGDFIRRRTPSFDEYVILLLALAPHLRPDFLERVIRSAAPEGGDLPELGGRRDADSRTVVPTGETAVFLLAGDDLERRFQVQRLFAGDHWLARDRVLRLEPVAEGAPLLSGRIVLDPEFIELFTVGHVSVPPFSPSFPARLLTTEFEWNEVVLDGRTREQIGELRCWLEHHRTLRDEWGMGRKLKPGYRALFHGPPGTGKTLVATLLGKATGRRVLRIDLSTVVSKYIGETNEHLGALFDRADRRGWILFFDEADALFGKRSAVRDAHDRYANQEVSYLLQRIEDFDGLVILASNFKANIDEAFLRRFNAIVHFPFPGAGDREAIWRASLPACVRFEEGVDLPAELARFELSGGHIINAVQHACLAAIARGSQTILRDDALRGIRRELEKEGKFLPGPPGAGGGELR